MTCAVSFSIQSCRSCYATNHLLCSVAGTTTLDREWRNRNFSAILATLQIYRIVTIENGAVWQKLYQTTTKYIIVNIDQYGQNVRRMCVLL